MNLSKVMRFAVQILIIMVGIIVIKKVARKVNNPTINKLVEEV